MRPASTVAQQRCTPAFSPVSGPSLPAATAPAVSFANTTTSTPPIRGIPIFTKLHRSSDWASASPLSSASPLRLSWEEYGRLQLQDEAVWWYHRCSALEQQLSKVQDAFNRQSRLLTAQWRDDGGNAACAKSSADGTCGSSVEAAAAEATARSPSRPGATLTSRSPATLHRTYAYPETEEEYYTGQTTKRDQRVGSEDSQHCPSEGRKRVRVDSKAPPRGPTLNQLAEGEMQYRIPKAYPVTAEDEDPAQDRAKHCVSSQVRRGPTEAGVTAASSSPSLLRISVGLQTDDLAPVNASFAHETRESPAAGLLSAFTEATREDSSCLPSTPGPSAIMSRQCIAAMEEVEMLRVRVDTAERRSKELQELCAAQELRCDDLETQLLGKEEQLLRVEQREPWPTTTPRSGDGPGMQLDAAAKSLLSVELNPLIVQARELLILVHPDSDGASREPAHLAAKEVGAAQATATDNGLCSAFDDFTAPCSTSSSPRLPSAESSSHLERGVAHLALLITQVRSAVIDFLQRFAALQAELDVVRADRNELIGEQSEQVRLLQEQLLEKDTAQWRLLEDLHEAQEQLTVATAQAMLAPADGATDRKESTALQDQGNRGGHSEEGAVAMASSSTAQLSSPPVCDAVADVAQRPSPQLENSAACHANIADTSAAEVAALQEQLAQVRAAAAAGQEAQRRVLSERLEKAELQLKETRLRAEDEYDRMSGTIEALTRELADTKEALRVKEVSLRIALRESFSPPLLITAQGGKTMRNSVVAGAPVAEGLVQGAASSTLPLSMQPLYMTSRGSAASSSSPRLEREDTRTSMSPSPPITLHLQNAAGTGEQVRDVADTDEDGGWLGLASAKARKVHPRFEDDGTLRTLPSAIVISEEGSEEVLGRTGQLVFPPATALTRAITVTATKTSSSREKSSRGLSVSTGGGSQDATSLPRGRSDANAAMLEQGSTAEETEPRKETLPTPPQPARAHIPLATQEEDSATAAFEEECTISSSLSWQEQKKSASARCVDTVADEELLLPPPLRSPLFRTPTSSASPSPGQQQRTPPPHRQEKTHGARLGINASLSQGREEQHGPPRPSQHGPRNSSSELSAQPLPLEKKLRQFLSVLSAPSSPFEKAVKGGGHSLPTSPAMLTWRSTPHSSSDVKAASNNVIPRDVMGAALPTAGSRAVMVMDRDETTPGRTPLSLYSPSALPSPGSTSTASRPSPTLLSGSPHSAEVTARHVQASLWRHREAWQQQELILHSLRSSPSP
ncbi:conserved hypothetical protein [Leishmania braziliensis MHOM/BR/75/M2904]|uniref:Uncharacterized protein n=2 Tax=Leishmania braziliensis TaxID=5660 RepID=A4H9M8_LEIBR|nr:conserved hypothetical protein [Leishmania braziliensis MHOM/BR/75/M2904]CAJ2470434.1 unnamed protein product [Leishmania braziliensis]CAM38102.1 conserved hypothetical protein [Leishmania braziliensis MHOM/BR/75/M2904]